MAASLANDSITASGFDVLHPFGLLAKHGHEIALVRYRGHNHWIRPPAAGVSAAHFESGD